MKGKNVSESKKKHEKKTIFLVGILEFYRLQF